MDDDMRRDVCRRGGPCGGKVWVYVYVCVLSRGGPCGGILWLKDCLEQITKQAKDRQRILHKTKNKKSFRASSPNRNTCLYLTSWSIVMTTTCVASKQFTVSDGRVGTTASRK
ncbi:unnamed protein product [Gadus morhua 'NCC']